jgi:hypothetical protein
MKTLSQPAAITPGIVVLLVAAALVTFIGLKGTRVPLLSNVRLDIILVVLLGMAVCTQGGIGRVAASGSWLHPLSIIGYILGGLILVVTVAVFAGWKLPYIESDQQALLVIAALAGLKVVESVAHSLLARS